VNKDKLGGPRPQLMEMTLEKRVFSCRQTAHFVLKCS
jgi:hypothetical protein